MISAGQILISIPSCTDTRAVVIRSTRPHYAQRFFRGKTVAYLRDTLPLLFNVCRGAQQVAVLRATEHALGVTADAQTEQYRDCLLRAEMLHEHFWKLFMDLPVVLGLPAWGRDMALASRQLRGLMDQLRRRCEFTNTVAGDAMVPRIGRDVITALRRVLFGSREILESTREELLGDSVAGKLFQALRRFDWASAFSSEPLPKLDADALQTLMAVGGVDYPGQISAQGEGRFESGVLARSGAHPLVTVTKNAVLGSRLAALLAETSRLLCDDMRFEFSGNIGDSASLTGCCEVETARGRLSHAVSLEHGDGGEPVVAQMHILAPTDWHFHPQGVAAQLLGQLPADGSLLPKRAELLVKLLNPCVDFQLDVAGKKTVEAMCHA